MTEIAWCLQWALVILVPSLFGWVVLRRVVREHDLAVLVPGAIIGGSVALMVLINELRYWLEFGPAAWFAYKLLLLTTLALLVVTRSPRHSPSLQRDACAPWKIAVIIAGAIVTGVYFGIPANSGFLNDAWWGHLPMAVQIQTAARFPLLHPFAVDEPLYYHFGPDLLAATWSFLLELPVQQGFVINIALFAPASFLLAFALTLRLSRNYFAGLAAGCFVVVGGNLRFFSVVGADLGNAASRLQIFNSQTIQGLLQLVFTPSHALGTPLMLFVVLLFRHFLSRPNWKLAAVVGLALGALTRVAGLGQASLRGRGENFFKRFHRRA